MRHARAMTRHSTAEIPVNLRARLEKPDSICWLYSVLWIGWTYRPLRSLNP
jgi:hypothetical protein